MSNRPEYTAEEMQYIYKDIKKRMHARYESRAELAGHLAAYIIIAVIGGFAIGAYDQTLWRVLGLLWTAGIFIHAVTTYFEEMREKAIDRELERYGLRPRVELESEKVKRDGLSDARLVTLSDDGELVDYQDEAANAYTQRHG